jgi:hypothetical protein
MTASEELKEKAANLPEPLAKEVLDFLLFVASRYRTELPLKTQTRSFRGAFKGSLSTSDEFAARKSSEKDLER